MRSRVGSLGRSDWVAGLGQMRLGEVGQSGRVVAAVCWGCHVEEKLLGAFQGCDRVASKALQIACTALLLVNLVRALWVSS
jgi:hypothetical protein